MIISASCRGLLRMGGVLSGAAGTVLLLGAAAPSSAGDTPARPPAVAGARATTSGGAWGKAMEVAANLNKAGQAQVDAVSCAAAGTCTAAGSYVPDAGGFAFPFVVSETNGTWGKAMPVAGQGLITEGAAIDAISCPAPGDCSGGGVDQGAGPIEEAFVVSETNGRWGKAKEVGGKLNTNDAAAIDSVSCAAPGDCSAGGYIAGQAFVVDQTNSTWGKVKEVAVARNGDFIAGILSVSCAAVGNCSAGGSYRDSSDRTQAFVIDETNGIWGKVTEVAAARNTGGYAQIKSVSCAAAGDCTAGGSYLDSSGGDQAFVVEETNGTWGKPIDLARTASGSGAPGIASVSCPAPGNCSAGGLLALPRGIQAFAANEVNGIWGKPHRIAVDRIPAAQVNSVSCAAPGNCSVGGFYNNGGQQAFVVSEVHGIWGRAKEVAGARNTAGNAFINSVSCAAGTCSAGGGYWTLSDAAEHEQAFVVSKP